MGDNKKIYLITGGAGFIGTNFIKYMFDKYAGKISVINFDALTYAGNLKSLQNVESNPDYRFMKGDIAEATLVEKAFNGDEKIDYVINFAAESHVDRSIMDSSPFIRANIQGVQVLLDASRKHGVKRFLQVSTDEVYGSLGETGLFTEETPVAPNSPYSASKAAADLLVRSYYHTHKMPVITTRCSNNYGPYQFPEKLIPLIIANVLNKKPLPVYGRGTNVRDWLYVTDHCSAIDAVIHGGECGEVYNIGGNNEWKNIDIVNVICDILEKKGIAGGRDLITYVKDRPGHDLRYAIDSSKMQRQLGWKPSVEFEAGIEMTIGWYLNNRQWWEEIISGEYKKYYETLYAPKMNTK
ncbi:MAG TPA: dTDP-glucose 4,6-dehydratase [Candidatus Wallbacteria bacterium]|nr:dTDP-glucose 4,6-dehydratase [Candidatus Wallbacteria bacterium]